MIIDKVTLLNETVLECLYENSEVKIFQAFMEVGIKILEADFGFVWSLSNQRSRELELVCKSPDLPFTPTARSEGRNYTVIKNHTPIFVDNIEKTPDVNYVSKYIKSYAIIPLVHKKAVHGSMVICFKKLTPFTKDKKTLGILLGNSAAQAITIHRLVAQEKETLAIKEKQKVTDALLAQEKLKNEFISNTTHEFRTPLTIMRGQIYLANQNLRNNGKPDIRSMQTTLKAIDEEIVNLSELISDLALITSGHTRTLELKPVNLSEIASKAANKLKNHAMSKGIALTHKTGAAKIFVNGEEKYLERVLLNIIRNAITYGKSWIKMSLETNKTTVSIKIEDDGIGISKEDLPHIFERFYRSNKARVRDTSHSGLGLAISKWIMDIHKGKIKVKSSEGAGSTFTVTLPKAKAEKL